MAVDEHAYGALTNGFCQLDKMDDAIRIWDEIVSESKQGLKVSAVPLRSSFFESKDILNQNCFAGHKINHIENSDFEARLLITK